MVEKTDAMSGAYRAARIAVLGAALGLTGCSLPGVSFHGVPEPAGKPAKGYEVQQITPQLLAEQAAAREHSSLATTNPVLQKAIADYAYKVQPQDVISVTVWGHPEFSSPAKLGLGSMGAGGVTGMGGGAAGGAYASRFGGAYAQGQGGFGSTGGQSGFTVDSDGSIYFPYVGNVHVAGLTVPEIRDKLTQALAKYVVDPQVTVSVIAFNSQTYQLAGSVQRPGLYPITNVPMTVSQAIQTAGGILRTVPNVTVASKASATPLADLAHVLYVHDGKREVLNMRAFFEHGDESQDRLLHPGDIVLVPDNSFDQVHLIGEVRDPGDYPLDNGSLNLAEALGKAGGLDLVTANPSRVFVFRGKYQKPEIFWLDARSPVTMLLATQFRLEPQDVVYVATAGITTWNRIITQILPTVEVLSQTKTLVK